MEGTRSRSIRLALAATVAVVAAIGASNAMTVAQAEPSASPEVHGWPGARLNPAGLYSWTKGSGWMHNVNYEGTPVEIGFEPLHDTWHIPVETITAAGADLEERYDEVERVTDTRIQAWLVDLPETRVSIIVRSFPDSDPALIAEAEAVVESVRVESQDDGTSRLVFMLPEGWDSG